MASPSFAPKSVPQKRLSLKEIDEIVFARLGTTRTLGNAQPACFNRQVAMYLAARIGGWSTTEIGRFYNGRDHSTVCHGIQRIEALRESDPELDALLCELKKQLIEHSEPAQGEDLRLPQIRGRRSHSSHTDLEQLADRIADRCAEKLRDLLDGFFGERQVEKNSS